MVRKRPIELTESDLKKILAEYGIPCRFIKTILLGKKLVSKIQHDRMRYYDEYRSSSNSSTIQNNYLQKYYALDEYQNMIDRVLRSS